GVASALRASAAFPGKSKARHSSFHEWRSVARRHVPSQAAAHRGSRQGAAAPRPRLTAYPGKALPMDYLRTERKTGAAFKSPYSFKPYGQSGIEVSEIFSKTAECIDDICVVRSMHADVPNHEPSLLLMNCG